MTSSVPPAPGTEPAQVAAEALAAAFTSPKFDYGDDGEGEYRELDTPADRVNNGMAVHFTASDGHRSIRSVTPREAGEVLYAAGLLASPDPIGETP